MPLDIDVIYDFLANELARSIRHAEAEMSCDEYALRLADEHLRALLAEVNRLTTNQAGSSDE